MQHVRGRVCPHSQVSTPPSDPPSQINKELLGWDIICKIPTTILISRLFPKSHKNLCFSMVSTLFPKSHFFLCFSMVFTLFPPYFQVISKISLFPVFFHGFHLISRLFLLMVHFLSNLLVGFPLNNQNQKEKQERRWFFLKDGNRAAGEEPAAGCRCQHD